MNSPPAREFRRRRFPSGGPARSRAGSTVWSRLERRDSDRLAHTAAALAYGCCVRSWLAVAVVALLACKRHEPPSSAFECPSCTWKLLGVHPQASAQATATGNALVTLCPWHGKLYVGYGDYQRNTGPVDVTASTSARPTRSSTARNDLEVSRTRQPRAARVGDDQTAAGESILLGG